MQSPPVVVARCLIVALGACASGESESSGASTEPEPASALAPAAGPQSSGSRAEPDELGEVVQELSDALWIVFEDSQGRHWFGSESQGVYRWDGKTLVRYTTRDGLADDHIRQILEDDSGNLFFATNGGISKFDGRSFSTLVPDTSRPHDWKLEPGDLWFNDVWFNGERGGPFRYDGRSLVHLDFPRIALEGEHHAKFWTAPSSPGSVYSILRDSRGSLWFGLAACGVCRYDGKSFTWITEDELTELDSGPSFGVRGLIEDKDGKFWLSNLLHRYDVPPNGATASSTAEAAYTREPGPVDWNGGDEPGNAYFMSGLRDRDGVAWMATYGAGVWRYDGKDLTHFPVLDGGQPITLFFIHEDQGGMLWLGTQANGAWRFNGRTFERFRP
jgi:hypothetical protein